MGKSKLQSKPKKNKTPRALDGVEQLVKAQFQTPTFVLLEFADGFQATLQLELLDMPMDRFEWKSLHVIGDGSKAGVTAVNGDIIPIDAATLRFLVDAAYAKCVQASLKKAQFSSEELERIARDNPPPPEWFDEPERDLTSKPWK